jgi:hypothetical protein
MREVSIKKLGTALHEAMDVFGANHKAVRRAAKRVKSAKLHYKLELRKSNVEVKI